MASLEDQSATDHAPHEKLAERLQQIRSQPKLQSQQQTGVVLSAVEDTLRDQKSDFSPTAYFAALLSLLTQYVSSTAGIVNKDVAGAVVYLMDLVTPAVPVPLLQAKFTAILESLAPAISNADADAPFLRSALGCLVSLLVAQDSAAWALPQSQAGPRQAVGGLLGLAMDHRPKVRKRAQEGLSTVLQNKPLSPARDHPAADMCAETALAHFKKLASSFENVRGSKQHDSASEPALIHSMQLIKSLATACGGWPLKSLESLCDVLFGVARSKSSFLTMTAFDVFEIILAEMSDAAFSDKVPPLLETIAQLQPSPNDVQLLPPWLAIVSRGYDVYAQTQPREAFHQLPKIFESIANYLASPSYNIRVSASECLVSFCVNCVPSSALLEPTDADKSTTTTLASIVTELFSVKYQAAWVEVFTVLGALLDAFRWQSTPVLEKAVSIVGELRGSDSFPDKAKADAVIGVAITSMGPQTLLSILPLNLGKVSPNQQGRAWLMPLLRDNISNTDLGHFKRELIPLSEQLYNKIVSAGDKKTMETKIFETLVQQIWSCLPGYCDRPLDLQTAFDQSFAEMLSNVLYQQPTLRLIVCRSLQTLVEGFRVIAEAESDDELVLQGRISRQLAKDNLAYLSRFSANMLAVLFNVYGETATQQRGPILNCIDTYLAITQADELAATFERVVSLLESSLVQPAESRSTKTHALPPTSHALMDIVVAMSLHLSRQSYSALFSLAASVIANPTEPQLQKKAYKLIPRLALSTQGKDMLTEQGIELRQAIANSSEQTVTQARKDRLNAIAELVKCLSSDGLSFIPTILPEVILGTKETNERAREAAYSLIVCIGEKMHAGGTITHDAGTTSASIDEYFTMLSAGLAGTSPHMISATITALSRCLFQFKAHLSNDAVIELIQTMDLFLKSPTREVVRSVLGFIKVCVLVLPSELMEPRLASLIPSLMVWSHEHRAHFRAKVKHILERMIRRYGVSAVERHCPVEDKKLIANIRKTRERRKRRQTTTNRDGDDEEGSTGSPSRDAAHNNEFDNALYGSSDDSDMSDSDNEDSQQRRGTKGNARKQQQTFIHEEEDEPLDLLDQKSLAHLSSTRPLKQRKAMRTRKTKSDPDGRLILGNDDESESSPALGPEGTAIDLSKENLEGGINAYVAAIRGRDAPRRGQRGRLKFTNRRGDDDDMDDPDQRAYTGTSDPSSRNFAAVASGNGKKGPPNRIAKHGHPARSKIGSRGADRGKRGLSRR